MYISAQRSKLTVWGNSKDGNGTVTEGYSSFGKGGSVSSLFWKIALWFMLLFSNINDVTLLSKIYKEILIEINK